MGFFSAPGPIQASLDSEVHPPEQVRPHLVSYMVSHVRSLLTLDAADIVSSRLDYNNALLHGEQSQQAVQIAQNFLVSAVCQVP